MKVNYTFIKFNVFYVNKMFDAFCRGYFQPPGKCHRLMGSLLLEILSWFKVIGCAHL